MAISPRSNQTKAQSTGLSVGLRRYLYATAAITGGIILVVEILGAKMLSPFFGTSHFVWTAQIAVTLVSLAAGYYYGGWLADQSPKLSRLYYCLLFSGAYLCFAVAVLRQVAIFCHRFSLPMGSVLASAFLFFVPLTLMSVTGPFVIRVLTRTTKNVGQQVGRLFALSTLGSVLGVVAVGYVLIPLAPNSVTMFVSALALFSLTGTYYLIWGRRSGAAVRLLAIVALAGAAGWLGIWDEKRSGLRGMKELARINSNYGRMQVLENEAGDRRYYLNDLLTQNVYDPLLGKSRSAFTYMLHDLTKAYAERPGNVLIVGLGIGIVPRRFAEEGVAVDVVEINPLVGDMARDYFDFDPAAVNLYLDDARHFFWIAERRYDAVLLDAFLGESTPSHLMTRECFQSVKACLKPGGILTINCFGSFDPGRDFFSQSLVRTLLTVFDSVRVHDGGAGNLFYVASDRPDLELSRDRDYDHVHPQVAAAVRHAFDNVVDLSPGRGIVFSDDYNPVEYYDSQIREMLRKDLVRARM